MGAESVECVAVAGVGGYEVGGELLIEIESRGGLNAFDVMDELGPAVESVLAGERELRVGE